MIDLDCSVPVTSLPPDSREILNDEYVRQAFANAATDEALATAIWDRIYSSQEMGVLRKLRLVPIGGVNLNPDQYLVIRKLSKSFLITCTTGSDKSVREVGRVEEEALRGWQLELLRHTVSQPSEQTRRVLESLWPSTPDSPDWRLKWTSFPLDAELHVE